MKREQALYKACSLLREQAKEESLARFLLQYLLEEDTQNFNKNFDNILAKDLEIKFFDLIDKHINNDMPLSHLLGLDYFYDRKFYVTKDVLSPRMETEELVYNVINHIKEKDDNLAVLDLCTGSGIIGITLKKEIPNLEVTCSDISEEALKVAKKNAINLEADIDIIQSDLFENIYGKYDLIVSNPPYISYSDKKTISNNVLNYDPHLALFAEENGMYFYRKILENAKNYLNDNGVIFFEIGYNQKNDIEKLAENNYYKCKVIKDINGKDRIAIIKKQL
ncbi:peptide chain release factor N(5)-glutamine methyltransferase [Gemelliphila palaticanis]|uniref:Release factor glutamine methyltransferase n=1 Tax=Gemelliphila palaticanis TaxID=81950 RepID=A0ABX2SXK2_9BACL|nr:peptide chain release factor N(5)-glutamine methyltransferase [Gemella palaticanis]MBF0715052.1 peptide chain release factor N(5)-glutamine methyltransferase [Gemella palaticanis]NYS46982.1 peptide chain release factor N(5)-glutamine methyltransferase [Gemella palaticanis]